MFYSDPNLMLLQASRHLETLYEQAEKEHVASSVRVPRPNPLASLLVALQGFTAPRVAVAALEPTTCCISPAC